MNAIILAIILRSRQADKSSNKLINQATMQMTAAHTKLRTADLWNLKH